MAVRCSVISEFGGLVRMFCVRGSKCGILSVFFQWFGLYPVFACAVRSLSFRNTGLTLAFYVNAQVVNPDDNLKFETLSYLPPLTDAQIEAQISYLLRNKWVACIEFDKVITRSKSIFWLRLRDDTERCLNKYIPQEYLHITFALLCSLQNGTVSQTSRQMCGYYDGRYWVMWKLPLFGATDASQVLGEVIECKKAYPDSFIRVIGFDSKRQVQIVSFIVKKPGQA